MKKIYKNLIPAAAFLLTFGVTSCTGDLDVEPLDPNMSTEVSPEGLFNKCYANIAMAGNGGANGDCDIDGIDGGTSGYIRQTETLYKKGNLSSIPGTPGKARKN